MIAEVQRQETVHELNELLGGSPVLLALPLGSKAPDRKLEECVIAEWQDVGDVNIAVLVGSESGNVISVDCDTEETAQLFYQQNKELCDATLTTVGKRGCNYWFVLDGECPPLKKLTLDGQEAGELRSSDGSKKVWTVIHGQHPDGPRYRIVNRKPAQRVSIEQLSWADGTPMADLVKSPQNRSNGNSGEVSEMSTRRLEGQKARRLDVNRETATQNSDSSAVKARGTIPQGLIDDAINSFLPTDNHQTNTLQFRLARRIKKLAADFDAKAPLWEIGSKWYDAAKPFLKQEPEMTKEDYVLEFLDRYRKVEKPEGATAQEAWRIASAAEHHPLLDGTDPRLQQLQKLCRVLAEMNDKDGQFSLGGNQVAELLNYPGSAVAQQQRGRRTIGALEALEVIKLVKVGHRGVCSTYRYLLDDLNLA